MSRCTREIWTTIFLVLLLATIGRADHFGLRNVVLPQGMKGISSLQELEDSLRSGSSHNRLYSVVRMAQLRNPQAVQPLIDAVADQPPIRGVDAGPGLRYYTLIAIGRIGGSQAESYLLGLAAALQRGDSLAEIPPGLDYMESTFAVYIGLAAIGTPQCQDFLHNVYSDADVSGQYRSAAYASYKRIILKEVTFATPVDSVYYLVDELRDTNVSTNYISPGVMSDEFIRSNGLEEVIVEYGQDYPETLEEYRSSLASDDTFLSKLDTLIQTVNERIKREGKRREFIQKGWLK